MIEFRKVLVTGGAGFIGSHLVDRLLSRGAQVVVFDNFSTGRTLFLPKDQPALTIVRGDVLELPALSRAMSGCDFVFHFQANADVRGGTEHRRIDLEQNTIATWNVLEAMHLQGLRGIAFASSATVYGEPTQFPTPESYTPLQTSLYGASKYSCEAMIQAYSEYFGFRAFIFRFVSWIGERYTHGIIFDILKKIRSDSTVLPLLGNGSQMKSYLYVKDGVDGIMKAISGAHEQKNIFNLGHSEYIDVVGVARTVLGELGIPHTPLQFAGGSRGWVGDSPKVHLDTAKLNALGWQPAVSIEEGIRRTVRFLQSNPEVFQRD